MEVRIWSLSSHWAYLSCVCKRPVSSFPPVFGLLPPGSGDRSALVGLSLNAEVRMGRVVLLQEDELRVCNVVRGVVDQLSLGVQCTTCALY